MVGEIKSRVDVSGVCCPLPLIELAKAVGKRQPGESIAITGNDPTFESSVRDFCAAGGHALEDVRQGDNGAVTIVLRVGG